MEKGVPSRDGEAAGEGTVVGREQEPVLDEPLGDPHVAVERRRWGRDVPGRGVLVLGEVGQSAGGTKHQRAWAAGPVARMTTAAYADRIRSRAATQGGGASPSVERSVQ